MVSLARKQSDQLETSLIKLSSLMRYMLFEVREDKVPLSKEIEYLQSYIDLQEQRFRGTVTVKTDLVNDYKDYVIEPMLLIPFVENAFKHGTGLIEHAEIDIRLKIVNEVLCFFVSNKYEYDGQETKDKTSGIGLANVRKRLNLLYGNLHQLDIIKKEHWHTISLRLNLN
jgi:LytS/YehU family sensor histidine kinase